MRLLITGTDIGVGKTWVACAIARALRDSGKQVVAIKPVETGCNGPPAEAEDGVRLARATGQRQPAHAIVRLPGSLAPALSSERAGAEIDFDALVLKIERFGEGADLTLVEGAGGLLAPITWEWNMADVARALGAGALVVAADRAGTINHTLLTISALELAGIPCAGVVLTRPEQDPTPGENAAAIARLSGIERVVTLPQVADQATSPASVGPLLEWLGRVGAPA
jgi:dethiobiotin synthetase